MLERCRNILAWFSVVFTATVSWGQATYFDNPELMQALEDQGYSLSQLLVGQAKLSNAQLLEQNDYSNYKVVLDTVSKDQAEMIANLDHFQIPYTKKVAHNQVRIFDMNWLRSKFATFKLVGVINRVDRQDFNRCGETRLLYRLNYNLKEENSQMSSTMPFTLNLIFDNPKKTAGDCLQTLKRWHGYPLKISEFVQWAKNGPLNFSHLIPKLLEVNIQILRVPSESAYDFGGQASYLMRAYDWKKTSYYSSQLQVKALENTPDVRKINRDSALRIELLNWIKANLSKIDSGVFLVPEKFLATRTVSVSTYGGFRLQNKLFEQIFKESDLGLIDYEGATYLNSNQALLERLNTSTCIGCHQNGSVAGFHFLGKDSEDLHTFNRLLSGNSPHFNAEIVRRQAYFRQQWIGERPNIFRPLSIAPPLKSFNPIAFQEAQLGMACTLPSAENYLKQPIRCRSKTDDGKNVSCQRVATNQLISEFLGVCLEDTNQVPSGGMSCLVGEIDEKNGIYSSRFQIKEFPYQLAETLNDKVPVCQAPVSGVPGGLVLRNCKPEEEKFDNFNAGQAIPSEVCGMRAGKRFDECATTGVFNACLSSSTARGLRTTCTSNRGCRADYICQKFPDSILGAKKDLMKNVGFCTPTYFIYQLRLDGHPDPLLGTKGSVLEKVYNGVWK